jgi:DNA-binding IscR family transcriptional regulator
MTHDLWEELNTTVYGFLESVNLSQLVERQRTKPIALTRGNSRARDPHTLPA